ncbi:MAG: HAMP domain-containing histidine kinase [Lachnospiraceae bacterium]|nr:HAMP domain-containing histidine kinase [Lachnospiraceae bacterium]
MEVKAEKRTGACGRFLGWLVSMLCMSALAVGFVSMYPRMTQEAREGYSEYVKMKMQAEFVRYTEDIYPLIDGMYVDWRRTQHGDGKTAGEIILGEVQKIYADDSSYISWYEGREETLSHWYENTYREELENSGVKFLIFEESLQEGYGNLNLEDVYAHAEKYPLFVELQFDEYGIPVVKQEWGVENIQSSMTEEYESRLRRNQRILDYSTGETIVQGMIPNVTVLLALDTNVYDFLLTNINVNHGTIWNAISAMSVDYTIYVLISIGIVILLGMLLPTIRPLGLKEGWKAHIPLEFLIIAAVHVAYFVVEYLPEVIVKCQIELDYPGILFYWIGMMEDIVADGRAQYVILGANLVVWGMIFFFVYLCSINVRQLFVKGIVRFFKENTLTGRILFWLYNRSKKVVRFCGTIDFSNKGNRNLILAVVINFTVIALLCCIWFCGILLAIPYSLFVFWLLQKKWNNIRTDYTVLLSTTEEMASGVTDVEYIGEAGVFHELQDALVDVQEGFHTAVQKEVKSQKMKTELITNVSHDLKTPLTAIITYVDLLKNEELTEQERREYVNVLEQKSARLKVLIEDLFEISKATSENIQLDKVDLDLVQLIQQVQLELEDEIMKSGITFKMNLPEDKVMVHLDAQKTCRIFENLTMNVLKYGLTGSRAYISMEQTEEVVRVMYKNVSEAEITYSAEEIMERFTRGDDSRNTEGSGLGLAIVKSFAEAQGGKARVELDDDLFKVVVTFPKARIENVQQALDSKVPEQTEIVEIA